MRNVISRMKRAVEAKQQYKKWRRNALDALESGQYDRCEWEKALRIALRSGGRPKDRVDELLPEFLNAPFDEQLDLVEKWLAYR